MLRFLYRYGSWLFIAYMIGGAVFLLLIESVFNGGLSFAVRILWLPLALLIFGFTWVNRQFFYDAKRSVVAPWLIATLLYPVALLMSWPYMMALNAATAKGDSQIYAGPIVRKWIHHAARSGDECEIDIRDRQSSQVITITVSPIYYTSHSVGDIATAEFMRGGFGIPYRWRSRQP